MFVVAFWSYEGKLSEMINCEKSLFILIISCSFRQRHRSHQSSWAFTAILHLI